MKYMILSENLVATFHQLSTTYNFINLGVTFMRLKLQINVMVNNIP